jgi:alternate signal-mediated exported protein
MFVALVGALGIGTSYAVWSVSANSPAWSITHGDLAVAYDSTSWRLTDQLDHELAASGNSQASLADLDELTTVCGTNLTLEVVDSYQLKAQGDNLAVAVAITWPADARPGVFSLLNQHGQPIGSDMAIGQDQLIALPPGSSAFTIRTAYIPPACDWANASTQIYGAYEVEVRQV